MNEIIRSMFILILNTPSREKNLLIKAFKIKENIIKIFSVYVPRINWSDVFPLQDVKCIIFIFGFHNQPLYTTIVLIINNNKHSSKIRTIGVIKEIRPIHRVKINSVLN